MLVPDRRTLIVLGTLITAMTIASGVLLLLEPAPVAPGSDITLLSVDRAGQPERTLFDTTPPVDPQRWSAIVIHHSGADHGSARMLNRVHERAGLGGLGYHFVVDNGQGAPDGQIEVGFRWRRQLVGAHSAGPHAEWYNRNALGICLIGDPSRQPPTPAQMRELVWLVQQLQAKFDIPPERVLLQAADADGHHLFPVATFRQQLLAPLAR